MAELINDVRPFPALHYSPEKIKSIGNCLSAPYDVISPTAQDAYYNRHPNNVVRLILGRITEKDTEHDNRYTRANAFLQAWKKEKVLIRSEHPSFFVYEQSFALPNGEAKTMQGFIGLVRLSDYEEGKILPHEKVLKKPVEDRIKLTMTTGTQFEYIWGLYQDEGSVIDGILSETEAGHCLIDYDERETGVTHKLFRLSDAEKCTKIEETMRNKRIYIADGHHRYQTMLNVREEMRRRYPNSGPDAPWEFIMMFLVNSAHEGLVILPTHRLLYGLPEGKISALEKDLEPHFTVSAYSAADGKRDAALTSWRQALAVARNPVFGIVRRDEPSFLTAELKDPAAYRNLLTERASDTWKMLDVNILNTLILQKILGLTEEMMSLQQHVEYCKDEAEALERVERGEMQAAFILNATPLEAVLTIAEAGEKMPRKSTFFFPKPVSGLVFFEMEDRSS